MLRSRIKTDKELTLRAIEGLRVAARRPNIYGYEPHEKQLLFHMSSARKRLFVGGNRSGKTVGGAVEATWRALGEHPYIAVPPPPTYGRVVSVDFKEGVEKIVKPEISRWLPPSKIRGGSWSSGYDNELKTLYLENGSFIEFMSYEQDVEKFAGTSRHWVWFDEEPPEDIYNECLMRLIDTGGDLWVTMTPLEGMTWTYDTLYEATNPNEKTYDPSVFVVEVESTMNPHLNPGEMDILLANMDEDDRKAREKGLYVPRGGLIWPNFDEKIHVIDPINPRQMKPGDWLHFAGMDHGLSNPTSWHWYAVDREGRIVVYDEYYIKDEVVKTHAANVLERERSHGVIPSYRVGDPSIRNRDPITGTSVQLEYILHGVPIILGNNDVPAGLDIVRRRFGGNGLPIKLYICRNNTQMVWEIKRYRFDLWAHKKMDREKNKKEEPRKLNDHACDDLRYACASRPQVEDHSMPEENWNKPRSGVISPYHGLTDPGTTRDHRGPVVDEFLGSEW